MDRHLALSLPMHLIQGIRVAQALMESDSVIHISRRDVAKFDYLRRFFRIRFEVGEEGVALAAGVCLSHAEPVTRIGAIERRLVFPREIVQRCHATWQATRSRRFSFCGLLNRKRRATLEAWTHSHDAELEILDSERGRCFPEKCWDPAYFEQMGQAEFVLCPSGDYVWSYRFFEAVLCGAIPVVEEKCAAFAGFQYYRMTDAAAGLRWCSEIAKRNYVQAVDTLTVKVDDLNAELAGIAIFDGAKNEWHQVREILREAGRTQRAEAEFAVIDEGAWSIDQMELEHAPLNFLGGEIPADESVAIAEWKRLRVAGTTRLVLAAPCFWWLDFYPNFAGRLHEEARSLRKTNLALVFDFE